MNIQWIEYGKAWGLGAGDTFTGKELNKEGTLIRVEGRVYLLGTFDKYGDFSGSGLADISIRSTAVVEAYAILINMDQFEVSQDTNTED
jgi:hypothetical protein